MHESSGTKKPRRTLAFGNIRGVKVHSVDVSVKVASPHSSCGECPPTSAWQCRYHVQVRTDADSFKVTKVTVLEQESLPFFAMLLSYLVVYCRQLFMCDDDPGKEDVNSIERLMTVIDCAKVERNRSGPRLSLFRTVLACAQCTPLTAVRPVFCGLDTCRDKKFPIQALTDSLRQCCRIGPGDQIFGVEEGMKPRCAFLLKRARAILEYLQVRGVLIPPRGPALRFPCSRTTAFTGEVPALLSPPQWCAGSEHGGLDGGADGFGPECER